MTKLLLNKGSLGGILVLLLVFGCSPVEQSLYRGKIISEDKNISEMDIFYIGQEIPTNYEIIDNFYVGPYESSSYSIGTDCGYEAVINRAKDKTNELDGNAFKITELKRPDAHHRCYRLYGLALKSND